MPSHYKYVLSYLYYNAHVTLLQIQYFDIFEIKVKHLKKQFHAQPLIFQWHDS